MAEDPIDINASSDTGGTSAKGMDDTSFPIIGIGASAGGLEALEAFFGALPADSGMAFVVIVHTSPEHRTLLPELLQKKTRIPVRLLEDGTAATPDTVFLPPSDRDPIIEAGVFRLQKRPARNEIHMPVDLFLGYLTKERGRFAACIILSGTGTDGTQGLRLIKENAGLSIVQAPASARHTGMPESALDTGLVDFAIPPAEMPACLIRYFKHPAAMPRKDKSSDAPDPLRNILVLLANQTRQDFTLYKENTLIRRIERRMTITNSRDASVYLNLLHHNPEEIQSLIQDLRIGVTSFFRDPEVFDFLRQSVLPDIVSRQKNDAVRVWGPGCATGEEAYSLAILLKECLEETKMIRELQIFGTDIDAGAIEQARQGTYVQNIAADVTTDRLKRFFTKENNRYRIKNDIRDQVVFAEQNILEDPPFSSLDLLVCRNLLIYLKQEAQERLIPLFHYALKNDGMLLLGSAESIGRHQDLFEPVNKQFNIYRKTNQPVRLQVHFPTGSRKLNGSDAPSEKETAEDPAQSNVSRVTEKILMAEHTPACVVVNESGEIIHFHGRTGKFLEPAAGTPTLQVADMAREGLRFALLSAMRRCREKGSEIHERDVRIRTNGDDHSINLRVKPITAPSFKNCQMVLFEDRFEPGEPAALKEGPLNSETDVQKVEELERELMRVRQDYRSAMEELQTSNEELRSANEELHSSNEELQSTNEELESSREELQSLNEELNTVNNELNNKMAELREAYNAVNAVLNSTRIAIVFLDTDLRLKRFTPEATRLLNLIESDVGRPMVHITHNLERNDLVEAVHGVLKSLAPVDEEVRTRDGHWYRMRIMVYRPNDKTIEGVVITLINIDTQKQAELALKQKPEGSP
ncbi:MAG: CheR family methyltransferase [Thermodesulfobacteriota bacterium]|nr:CheR family methyltransferase [Thermodesulfobacteriota bacterium]